MRVFRELLSIYGYIFFFFFCGGGGGGGGRARNGISMH